MKKRFWDIVEKVVNVVLLLIQILVYLVFSITMCILICYKSNEGIASILDLVIAVLSIGIVMLSCIRDEKKKYIWVGNATILLMTVIFIVLNVIGMKNRVPSSISLVGLFVALVIQVIENIRVDYIRIKETKKNVVIKKCVKDMIFVRLIDIQEKMS